MDLSEFSQIVSTALHFDFDASLPFPHRHRTSFPPQLPSSRPTPHRPNTASSDPASSRPSYSKRPSTSSSTHTKQRVISRIKSLLLRPQQPKIVEEVPVPAARLGAPEDPVFSPWVPLVSRYEREMKDSQQSSSPTSSESSCSSNSDSSPVASTPSSPASSFQSHPPEYEDDPFAKSDVQVLEPPTSSTSTAFSIPHHPYSGGRGKRQVPRQRPMPTCGLPPIPPPCMPLPAVPTENKDWTLDLELPFDVEGRKKKLILEQRRRRVVSIRRVSSCGGLAAAFPMPPTTLCLSSALMLRPGHRRQGSPFPLMLPPLTIPPPPSYVDAVVSPICSSPMTPDTLSSYSQDDSAPPTPMDGNGRTNIPGWFDDDDGDGYGDEYHTCIELL